MNGATALPCASTISTPSSAIINMMGINQNFLRARKNAHRSLMNDMVFLRTATSSSLVQGQRDGDRSSSYCWIYSDASGVGLCQAAA